MKFTDKGVKKDKGDKKDSGGNKDTKNENRKNKDKTLFNEPLFNNMSSSGSTDTLRSYGVDNNSSKRKDTLVNDNRLVPDASPVIIRRLGSSDTLTGDVAERSRKDTLVSV